MSNQYSRVFAGIHYFGFHTQLEGCIGDKYPGGELWRCRDGVSLKLSLPGVVMVGIQCGTNKVKSPLEPHNSANSYSIFYFFICIIYSLENASG